MIELIEKERQIIWNALRVARDMYTNHAMTLRVPNKDVSSPYEEIAKEFDKQARECTDMMVKFE